MRRIALILVLLVGGRLLASPPEYSQTDDSSAISRLLLSDRIQEKRKISPWRMIVFSTSVLGCVSYAYSRMDDWWGHEKGEPHIKHDDWNGDNLAQTDEVSHLFISYKLAQTATHFARWTGVPDGTSRIIGASLSTIIMTWVEYPVDTYNPVQGFGYSDMLANIAGIGLAIARDRWMDKLDFFDFRFSIKEPKDVPNEIIAQTFAGNDSYIYWLVIMPTRKFPVHPAIGYSANHKSPDRIVEREVYLGFGTSAGELAGLFSPKLRRRLDLWNAYEISFYFRVD